MKFFTICIGVTGLVLAGLLAGCRTTSPRVVEQNEADPGLSQRAAAYAHYAAGIVQEVNGNAPAAWEEFYQAARADRHDAELLADVAKRLIEGRQYEQALEVLLWASRLPEGDGMVYLRLGFVYSQLGQRQKAIESNRQAVRRLPGFLPAWHNFYLSYAQARQGEPALAVLDEAARQKGIDAVFRVNLAELYAACGQQFPTLRERARLQAMALLDQVLAEDSLRGMNRLKLADGFYLLGAGEKAAKLYLEFLAHGEPAAPLRDMLRAKLTEIYLRDQDRARALEQLTAITRENPANAGAHYFLGALALEDKHWNEAQEHFQHALEINPDFEAARLDLVAAQIGDGKTEAALAELQEYGRRRLASFPSEYLAGLAYYLKENYTNALPHFLKAESLARIGETNRLDTGFYFQLGAVNERLGNHTEAAKYFEKSIALAPDNAEALNYLGYMWAERGENLARAKELIERALKLEPDNEAFLDSMGWVLFKLGDTTEAVVYLEQAVAKLKEPDATIFDHLGDVLAARNEMDKAREAWAKSLAIEANDRIRQKLKAAGGDAKP
jgi:tetratricopeptide (TPR) repeat protein